VPAGIDFQHRFADWPINRPIGESGRLLICAPRSGGLNLDRAFQGWD
jgi:hypothetical protein